MKQTLITSIKTLLFISIFAVIMHIMNFCLVASNWASIDRWERYSSDSDYDTLFVGSSVGWVIVPRTINGMNNCRLVNMSTPDQFYKTSLEAVRFVSCQQPLDTVVLLTGFDALEKPEDYAAAASFLEAEYETAPASKRICAILSDKLGRYTDIDFLSSTDSINIWFDWVERFTYSIPQIGKNIAFRLGRKDPGYVLDMNMPVKRVKPGNDNSSELDHDINKALELNLSGIDINPKSLGRLNDMASYLEANNIRFVVIVTPHRSDVRDGYGDEYETIDSYLEDFVTKRGGKYFNIDSDPELRAQLPDDMFKDREHIVDEGNDIVSKRIAQLLR